MICQLVAELLLQLGQRRNAAPVALDRDDRCAGIEQGAGQAAGAGPDFVDALAVADGPGMAAIRASSCRSRMKFCPSALLALSPWRAMTSRSGSGGVAQAGSARSAAHSAAMRIAAAIGRGSARSWPAMSNAVP